jgi:predicted kinase
MLTLFGRGDERSALGWMAHAAGVPCEVVFLPVDRATQFSRVRRRQERSSAETFAMTEEQLDAWRAQFEAPDAAELAGLDLPTPPAGYTNWMQWAADRWPSLS